MSIIERLKKNLSPEQYTAVMDALGDDFDFDLVPRARLNKVISQRNTLREQLASGLQTDGDDGDDGEGNEPKGTPKSKAKVPAAGAGTGDLLLRRFRVPGTGGERGAPRLCAPDS